MTDLWGEFISKLEIDLPEKGLASPEEESIEDGEGELEGSLVKITFDVILFMNHKQDKYFMMQSNQRLTQMGQITLKDALLKFNKKPPPKKRKG